jgi:hypothetical protein
LQTLILTDSRVFQYTEVDVVESVGTKDVAACITDAFTRLQCSEESISSRRTNRTAKSKQLFNRHV